MPNFLILEDVTKFIKGYMSDNDVFTGGMVI